MFIYTYSYNRTVICSLLYVRSNLLVGRCGLIDRAAQFEEKNVVSRLFAEAVSVFRLLHCIDVNGGRRG